MTFARKSRVAAALAMALGMSSAAVAQDTSSAMRGKIVGPEGNPAANTKITVIHQPSGTVREFMTNDSGTFLAKGLRVGGPYTVIVDSEEFRDKVEEGLSLTLGETYRLNVQLDDANADMERIVVTGAATAFLSDGASSSYGAEEIARAPAFNRDLKDIVRNNPLATVDADGNLSIGGNNPRFNSITIDGIGQNDDFGLNSGGYPTQRSPISLDAIDQISVDSSPFSSKVGGFSGGLVNAVTKSGTNEFHGSVFYEFTNENLAGTPEDKRYKEDPDFDPENPVVPDNIEVGEEETFGVTLGGPILKDELFFFLSYEQFEKTTPTPFGLGSGSNPSDISMEDYQEFSRILNDTYGLTDSLSSDPEDEDKKVLLKLDWNINDDHRADFTFQYQNNAEDRNFSEDADELVLASNMYTYKTLMQNYATHLYSNWTDDFSTELAISYKDTRADSLTNSDIGEVSVRTGSGDIVFGTDAFRHANVAKTSTLRLNFDANWLLGDHDIKFGYQGERLRLYNLFAESSMGVWGFAPRDLDGDRNDDTTGLEDFENRAPDEFNYKNAYDNNPATTAYSLTRFTHSLYIEDTFSLTDDFEVTAGVRYERLESSDEPRENENFVNTYGTSNTENLDGLDIILPRIGFKWYLNEDMTLRGGIGRYSGGKPNVWVANSFTNDGITFVSAPFSTTSAIIADPAQVDFANVPQAAKDSLTQGSGSTNYVDPNYKMASDWRAQLGLKWNLDIPYLGEDYTWDIEANYVKKKDSPFWVDTSRVDNGNRTADGSRIIYDSRYTGDLADNYDIMLTNADKDGRSVILTTSLKKQWDNGVRMNLAYTHQDITEANPGTSSRAVSNYQYNVTLNRNEPLVGDAYYQTEHRLVLNLGYKTEFFDGYATTFDLFFERRSGRPLSWTLGAFRDGDLGDQPDLDDSDVYLPYIPTGADDTNVDWDGSRLTYEEMKEIIDDAGLAGYAGGYVDKNDTTQPWVTTLDLNMTQEIPGFAEGHKGIFYVTIDNLANLLNDDWGQVHQMEFPQQILFDYDINSETGQYQYRERFGGTDTRNYNEFKAEESTWRIKMGVRYRF